MTGLTKDAGWQLGVRRTVSAPPEVVWAHLVDAAGLRADVVAGGTVQEVRSRSEHRRLRVRWREEGAEHVTTLQLTFLAATRGTTIAVHQEHLTGPEERERLLAFWTDRVEALAEHFSD